MSIDFFEEWNRITNHNEMMAALNRNNSRSDAWAQAYEELRLEFNELAARFRKLRANYDSTRDEKKELMSRLQEAGASLEDYKAKLQKKQEIINYRTKEIDRLDAIGSMHMHEGVDARDSGYLSAIVEQRMAADISTYSRIGVETNFGDLYDSYREAIILAERNLRIEYTKLALGLMGKSEAEIEQIIEADSHAIMTDINAQYAEGIRKLREESVVTKESGEAVYHFIKEDLKKGGSIRAYNDRYKDYTAGYAEIVQGRLIRSSRPFGDLKNNDLEYQRRLQEVALDGKYRDRILYTPGHEKADEELKQGLFDFTVKPDKTIKYALAFAVLDEYIREKNGLPPLTDAINDIWRAEFNQFTNRERTPEKGHNPLMSAPANISMTPEAAFNYLRSSIGSVVDPTSIDTNQYQVNSGVDGSGLDVNGYLFHLIYAGIKGSNLSGMGVRENNPGAMIYNEGTISQLDREYNWMMPLAAEEFKSKFKITAPKIDISHVMGNEHEDESYESNGFEGRHSFQCQIPEEDPMYEMPLQGGCTLDRSPVDE